MKEGCMFGKGSDLGFTAILEGIEIKTVCHGESTLMTEFRMRKGARLPDHTHPNEQTGYLIRGRIRLFIGGLGRELAPGDSWCIAGDVPHRAEILEDSAALEVFSPRREDYLQFENEADIEV
jgi:quercetin dioxygenase-like cupin family protein